MCYRINKTRFVSFFVYRRQSRERFRIIVKSGYTLKRVRVFPVDILFPSLAFIQENTCHLMYRHVFRLVDIVTRQMYVLSTHTCTSNLACLQNIHVHYGQGFVTVTWIVYGIGLTRAFKLTFSNRILLSVLNFEFKTSYSTLRLDTIGNCRSFLTYFHMYCIV